MAGMSCAHPILTPDEVDRLLRYPRGRAARLARAGLLPCIILPDGEVRFERQAIADALSTMRKRGKGEAA